MHQGSRERQSLWFRTQLPEPCRLSLRGEEKLNHAGKEGCSMSDLNTRILLVPRLP